MDCGKEEEAVVSEEDMSSLLICTMYPSAIYRIISSSCRNWRLCFDGKVDIDVGEFEAPFAAGWLASPAFCTFTFPSSLLSTPSNNTCPPPSYSLLQHVFLPLSR